MSQHPIDKLFQQGLGKHKAAVPDSLWAGIAADQQKKATKARNFKVAMFSGSLLLLMLFSFLFWQNGQQPAVQMDTPAVTAEQPDDQFPATEETALSNSNQFDDSTEEHEVTTSLRESSTTNETQVTTANSSLVNQTSADASNRDGSTSSADVNSLQPTELKTLQFANAHSSDQSVGSSEQLTTRDLSAGTELPDAAIFSAPNVTEVAPVAGLPLPRLAPYERSLPEITPTQTNTIRKRRKGIEVDILGGFAYAHQILSTDSEDNRNVLDAREISEFPALSYLAGLRVSYRLTNQLSLRSGINYGQIRNQFEYDQQVNLGTDSMQTILIRSNNRIRLLELPFLLGFELPGKRFRLAVNAGPVLNLSAKASGRYLLPNQQRPVLLEDETIYRTNIGLGWQGSLTAAYNLGGGNSLLIEPTFKSYPRSFTTPDYPLKERYWMAGLQIGLRHRIR